MKYFLATYEILDGEHEHHGAIIIEAENMAEAINIAEANEHDTENYTHFDEADKTPAAFDCRDGETAATVNTITEITEQEMQTLERLSVAYRI